MSSYIYLVTMSMGRSNPKHGIFLENVTALNAKSADYSGINNVCILSHSQDADTVHLLCSERIKNKSDITVEEITKETLNDQQSSHRVYTDLIERYYLPYGDYPNLK